MSVLQRTVSESSELSRRDRSSWHFLNRIKYKCVYRAKRYILDKRYTKATLRNQLSQSIIDLIQKNSQDIVQIEISHCDSIEYAELRAVDFVAYETYQKYKNKSEIFEFISCLEHKELIFKNISWENIKKESLTP